MKSISCLYYIIYDDVDLYGDLNIDANQSIQDQWIVIARW